MTDKQTTTDTGGQEIGSWKFISGATVGVTGSWVGFVALQAGYAVGFVAAAAVVWCMFTGYAWCKAFGEAQQ